MTPTSSRPRAAALPVSLALHGLLLAAMAVVPVAAHAPADDGGTAVVLSWTRRAAPEPEFLVSAPVAADLVIPPPVLERIEAPETVQFEMGDPEFGDRPVMAETPCPAARDERPTPNLADLRDVRGPRAPHPGRGPGQGAAPAGPGQGGGAAPGASIGVGGGGSGGGGGHGTGTGSGLASGRGFGQGSDGDGSGYSRRGGPTRAAAVVGMPSPPRYPEKARARGWEGRVVLSISLDADGRVLDVSVAESSGRSSLDDAACEAAHAWTFAPALADGRPVAASLRVPVRFELTD